MALPVTPGEIVTEGVLFRFIPNLAIYWEYDRDRPSPRAFRRRPREGDVSMYIDGFTTVDRLQALKPAFGIYAVRTEKLIEFGGMTVIYDPDLTLPEGKAKVAVTGINRRRAEHIAREIGERINPPGAVVDSLAEEDQPET